MTKANECTCPSGDGSLRWPCPKHPAVEHERAEFEAWVRRDWPGAPLRLIRDALPVNDPRYGQYCDDALQRAWVGWQARAALAQPSPVSEALIYACKNLAQITSSDGSGHADIAMAVLRMAGVGDDERERLVNEWKAARAWKPSPAQAEKAEAERPEVVGYLLAKGNGTLSILRAGPSDEPVMTVTQHEHIIKNLRFERQQTDRAFTACINERDSWAKRWDEAVRYGARIEEQRDAALARVAELERKLSNEENAHTTTIEQRDNAEHWADQLAKAIAERFGVDIGEHSNLNCPWNEALVWMQQPPAQAQHSVPEGWMLVPVEPTQAQLSAGQTAWLADPMRRSTTLYRAMLAAAPQPVTEGE
ncbi:hypothetical protein ACYTSF_28755 [Pseudomonas aeruginosa]